MEQLLSQLVDEENVATIEVDPDLAEQPRERLLGAGLALFMAVGESAQG